MNPTEPNVPAIRQRRPMTEARLKANRENAKKAALSGRSGRPRGSMDGNRLSLRERCRVRDEEHVATLERIAPDDSHPGFQLVAIQFGEDVEPRIAEARCPRRSADQTNKGPLDRP